jgi:hypothetical protein
MAFFIKGIGSIYCGYHRQVNAKVLSPSLIKEISDLCYSKAKRLNEQGDTYKIGWIFPDQVTLTPKAIIYTRKTLFKDEMVYLPYKRINMVLSDRKYLFWKRISVFGEQDINLKHLVLASKAAKIEEVLKKHGVDPTKGIPFNSAKIFPSNWFGRAPKIVCMDDCIVYYPNRIGGKELQSCMLKYKDISTITYYKKFLSLFGTVAISGVVDNIRQDQSDTYVRMEIPDLFAFKFKWAIFTGRLKRILQDKTNVEIERVRGNN